ncbi:helix-turn-helix transcriptional regulator [Caballeronia sordidicola]|uniref:Putative DNA-binding protein n=1 Tax=Caballeronia sordidicola TaxID=196367 RepID=A0A242M5V6_CABSO|nr:helix-turn-helix transcriptional regulator [Caballeronia sordidicola]OTP66576.1 putative DNA-binding protein [Caballeronia sordidicola]
MKKPAAEERKALGAFLSSRRGRLQPADLGISTGQRRTPGLRREEVAVLAGISVSWYTRLEQGRDISASAATLERLARVLRLDRAEAEHLLALSSRQTATIGTSESPSDTLLNLIQAIDPVPAYIRNHRLDILAWNSAVADLFVDYGTLEPPARNTLYLMFLYAPYRELIHEWERIARGTIGVFRAARAKASDKAPYDELIEEISAESEEFRHLWRELDVQGFEEGIKRLNHPTRGRVDLAYVALVPEGRPDLSFVSYLPSAGGGD